MASTQEQVAALNEVTSEAKKDIVFLISFFRLPQPFKVFLKPQYDYQARTYQGHAESLVKIKGRKVPLASTNMHTTSVEEFLQKSILEYEKKRQ